MQTMKQWFSRGFVLPAAAVCALLVPCTTVQAALVNYSFTGTVGDVSKALKSTMPSGSSMWGTFSFDNETPSTPPGSGRYMGAIQSFSLNFGSYSVSLDPTGDTNAIRIVDSSSGDLWRLKTSVTGNSIESVEGINTRHYVPAEFRMDLEDEDGEAITGTSPLQNPPSLGDLSSNRWRLVFEDENSGRTVRVQGLFNSVSLTAVPLPAAVLLFGAGLISLVGLGAGGLRNLRGAKA
ncbi:MAG: hypothetical protein HP496_02565 [Nitrospira sp.]|nr:hypothetical protein [Nitrospira sp.]